jgi:serine/threonine protein kinase
MTKDWARAVKILAGNVHPTVLRLVGFSLDESSRHIGEIVTEFHENGDLASVLASERSGKGRYLNETQKSKIIFGLVCGMAYLHSRGVLHRLLTPDHVLLNESWEPVIGGFTLDIEAAHMYYEGAYDWGDIRARREKVRYLAPEAGDNAFSSDVFSFAMTLYEIFESLGTLDDGKGDRGGVLLLVRRLARGDRYVRPRMIPEYHWKVITWCWKDDPKDRPTFAMLLSDFLSRHEYILPGADRSSVLEYECRISADFGPPKTLFEDSC